MEPLVVPQGEFDLARYPARSGDRLRAWDAADELVLRHLAATTPRATTTVIVNDQWGALATALASLDPVAVADSYRSRAAIVTNAGRRNGPDVRVVAEVDRAPARVDLAVVRVPKSLALLQQQLRELAPRLHAGSVVVGAGMTKHLPPGAHTSFEAHIGPTRPSRAEKKARLIHCDPDASLVGGARQPASPAVESFVVEPDGLTVCAYPGVFSAARLDAGTRVLLPHLPSRVASQAGRPRIVDLGCGNGVIGLICAARSPDAHVTFVDDSNVAVRSAALTWRTNFGESRDARFADGDGLDDLDGGAIEAGSIDLVVTNPPFHREHTVGDETAWRFFVDAHRALRAGGELLVVGNRHLGYHAKVKRVFANAEVVSADPKFVVVRAMRR